MKFSLLKVEEPHKLKKLSKNKASFFKKEDDVSLFHYNKLNNDLYHVVFNVNDEYQIGTKKLGRQHNYSYSSLVNFFFLLDCNYALVEHINNQYRDEVIDFINNSTKTQITITNLDNRIIMNIYNSLNGVVKKIEYSNDGDELFDKNFATKEELFELASTNCIDRITLLVDGQYISVTKEGRVTVDNSEENFLIHFSKRVLESIV